MQTNHQDKEIREVTHFAAARSGMYKQQKALLPSFICALFFKVHHVIPTPGQETNVAD
jgi:hypothetical protein